MNENLDLTKILEGLKGIELYTSSHGYVFLEDIWSNGLQFKFKDLSGSVLINEKGCLPRGKGECIIFPSKEQRDWSKFVRPIKEGTPIMCCQDRYYLVKDYWVYRKYTKKEAADWLYIIPFDKFDPNDIEGSIEKYNIQK